MSKSQVVVLNFIPNYSTQISSSIDSYFESPIPETFLISSILENSPFFVLYSMIFRAVEGPIPLSASSSVWVAVLMFTFSLSLLSPSKMPSAFSVIIVTSSPSSKLLGIYIFCPSFNLYAKLTLLISASDVSPPACSIASAILSPSLSFTIPSSTMHPVICTIISCTLTVSSTALIFSSYSSSICPPCPHKIVNNSPHH